MHIEGAPVEGARTPAVVASPRASASALLGRTQTLRRGKRKRMWQPNQETEKVINRPAIISER